MTYRCTVVTEVGRVPYPDMVAEIADRMIRLEGTQWSICFGLHDQRIYFSVRTNHPTRDAGELVKKVLGDEGVGGGHDTMAAGRIQLLEESEETYQRVVNEYPDQRDQVDAAREKLAALDVRATSSDTLTVRELVHNDGSRPGADFDVSRDGHRFVYTQTGDLVTSEPDTGKAHHFYGVHWSNDCETFGSPVLSPDDTRVAYNNFPCRGATTRIFNSASSSDRNTGGIVSKG